MKNYFIEGIQGTGKTTMMRLLNRTLRSYKVFFEGDISPIDLSWCSYLTLEEYDKLIEKYIDVKSEIEKYSITENNMKIVAYTRIITDYEGFHKDFEKFNIYHGNKTFDEFKKIVLSRYKNFYTFNNIFESSIFQYNITTMMLFYNMSNKEIIEFYKEVFEILKDKNFRVIYLSTNNIYELIKNTSKSRLDLRGEEIWISPLIRYIENSPKGIEEGYSGIEGLVRHLEERKNLELTIIEEHIKDRCVILDSNDIESTNFEDLLK